MTPIYKLYKQYLLEYLQNHSNELKLVSMRSGRHPFLVSLCADSDFRWWISIIVLQNYSWIDVNCYNGGRLQIIDDKYYSHWYYNVTPHQNMLEPLLKS